MTTIRRHTPEPVYGLSRALGLLCVVWVVAPLVAGTGRVAGADLVIVKSSGAAPYKVAAKSLADALERNGNTSRVVLLKELSSKDLDGATEKRSAFFAVGTKAAVFLKDRLPEGVTLTYCMVVAPTARGLTGRSNTLGVSTEVPLVAQFQLMEEALPDVRRVGVLYRSKDGSSAKRLKRARLSLPAEWQIEAIDVDGHASFAQALDELFRRRPDLIWTTGDRSVYASATIRALLLAAIRRKTPVFGFSAPAVRAGALLGVAVDPKSQGRRAGALFQSFSGGAAGPWGSGPDGAERTAHQSSDVHIAVNRVVAEQLGVTLPDGLVQKAKYVFPEKGRP